MSIHGIVSTYFGDLEYDIGKTLQWSQPFFDSLYILDSNIDDGTRQYVIDWDRQVSAAKYSFYSKPFFSPAGAVDWRKEAFDRAKTAWTYDPNDWVMFIDGTECLNVFHAPPTEISVTAAFVDTSVDQVTFTTAEPHGMVETNAIRVAGAVITIPAIPASTYTYTQVVASDIWTVEHDLATLPTVTNFVDVDPSLYVGVSYTDLNTAVLTFSEPVTGAVDLVRAFVDASQYNLDGTYVVVDVPDGTSVTAASNSNLPNIGTSGSPTPFDSPAVGTITTEPVGYYTGTQFQCWLAAEIAAAEADGYDQISLDAWAMIRSSGAESVPFKLSRTGMTLNNIPGLATDDDGDYTVPAPRCDEYYLPMGSLVRLIKVSALLDEDFPWSDIDQPQETFVDAYPADLLSLISYAYVRWAENPKDMTQTVNVDEPNYVAGDALEPAFRPVTEAADVGFFLRTLISQVRPIDGAPLVWEDDDDPGEQPMVGDQQKLDLNLVPVYLYRDIGNGNEMLFSGYQAYGGTPLYPGVLRANRREGLWYVKRAARAVQVPIASAALADGIATLTTATRHYLTVGTTITVSGIDASFAPAYAVFDGQYTIVAVTATSMSYARNPATVTTVAQTSLTSSAMVTTWPPAFGPIPWNYLTNSFNVADPLNWINSIKRPYRAAQAIRVPLAAVSLSSGVATLTAVNRHYLTVGTVVTVLGVDGSLDPEYAVFDGQYVLTAVTGKTMSYQRNPETVTTVPQVVLPNAAATATAWSS